MWYVCCIADVNIAPAKPQDVCAPASILIPVVGCATISADFIGIGDVIAPPIRLGWCVFLPTMAIFGGVAIRMRIALCLGV